MFNIKILKKQFYRYFVHKVVKMLNPIALRTAKTPKGFGPSECNRVKLETGHTGSYPKVHKICSKVIEVICIIVQTCMLNLKILFDVLLHVIFSQSCSYIAC